MDQTCSGLFRTRSQVAGKIDHTLLDPAATGSRMVNLCREAVQYGFGTVCVHPVWVATCTRLLAGTGVKVATVIGFPLGATLPRVKAFEAGEALLAGAVELDMVMNIGWAKEGSWSAVEADISGVVQAARKVPDSLVKVILETSLLTHSEISEACRRAMAAGADYVKTATGFGAGGATVEHIGLMARTGGGRLKVKAAGGIRTAQTAVQMLNAGADRLGTSAGLAILAGFEEIDCKE
ncbi:MAG: deoxyribose-phosphate aldolase [Heliobacteriaceae bacterium]|nr:deoxyribose-phosphate aldolase [Heliobacteriaceae bacterium]